MILRKWERLSGREAEEIAQWDSVYRTAWGPEFRSPCPKPGEKHLPVIPELGKVEAGGWHG